MMPNTLWGPKSGPATSGSSLAASVSHWVFCLLILGSRHLPQISIGSNWCHLLMIFVSRPVPPAVLLDEIEAAELEGNDDRIEGVLCGAVRQLKGARAKPDSCLYLSLMYLAKMKPNIFATEGVIEVRASGPLPWEGGVSGPCGFPVPQMAHVPLFRPCVASCVVTPPSTSRPRATVWCRCWPVTCSWPPMKRMRTGPRSLLR